MQENQKKFAKGFTLVELLIVVAIMGMIAAFSWGSMVSVRNKTVVDNACQGVATLANKTRGYALAGINNFSTVSLTCSSSSCLISVPGEVAFAPQSVTLTPFTLSYALPYAGAPSGTGDYVIEFLGNAAFKKTLHIDSYKAVCQ